MNKTLLPKTLSVLNNAEIIGKGIDGLNFVQKIAEKGTWLYCQTIKDVINFVHTQESNAEIKSPLRIMQDESDIGTALASLLISHYVVSVIKELIAQNKNLKILKDEYITNMDKNKIYTYIYNLVSSEGCSFVEDIDEKLYKLASFIKTYVDENGIDLAYTTDEHTGKGFSYYRINVNHSSSENSLLSIYVNSGAYGYVYSINLYGFLFRTMMDKQIGNHSKKKFADFLASIPVKSISEIQVYADYKVDDVEAQTLRDYKKYAGDYSLSHTNKGQYINYFTMTIYDSKTNKKQMKKSEYYPEYDGCDNVFRMEFRIKIDGSTLRYRGKGICERVMNKLKELFKLGNSSELEKDVAYSLTYDEKNIGGFVGMVDVFDYFQLIKRYNFASGDISFNRLFLFMTLDFGKLLKRHGVEYQEDYVLSLKRSFIRVLLRIYGFNDNKLVCQGRNLLYRDGKELGEIARNCSRTKRSDMEFFNTIYGYSKKILLNNYLDNDDDSLQKMYEKFFSAYSIKNSDSFKQDDAKILETIFYINTIFALKSYKYADGELVEMIKKLANDKLWDMLIS